MTLIGQTWIVGAHMVLVSNGLLEAQANGNIGLRCFCVRRRTPINAQLHRGGPPTNGSLGMLMDASSMTDGSNDWLRLNHN